VRPQEGILGKPFLVNNCIIIDNYIPKIIQSNKEPIEIAPHTETIIPVHTTASEDYSFVF